MDDTSLPDDERDGLAALDLCAVDGPDEPAGDAGLDALDFYAATDDEKGPASVTNPPGTVTVSSLPDGRVKQIELSPRVTAMTEADLAAEIVVIAALAAQEARSAQFASMLDGMRRQGHADAATRDFLTRDLGLPSPEQARAERARVFATRYRGEND